MKHPFYTLIQTPMRVSWSLVRTKYWFHPILRKCDFWMKKSILNLNLILFLQLFFSTQVSAQQVIPWNTKTLLNSYRILQPMPGTKPEFIDLDNDGDPDLMRYTTSNGFAVQWIDDDDDMRPTDLEGDTDNDCIMADINKDGNYGSHSDVIIDWVDTNSDGKADLQIYADFAQEKDKDKPWGPGHFMVNMDLDKDDIMNYVDYNNFKIRCWIHDGKADFFEDYSGHTLFLKIHASPQNINDLRLNWENPFLFYDTDKDGLTECAIRLLDRPTYGTRGEQYITKLTGKIDYVTMAYDLDNDNSPANPFDFDMTITLRGGGFDYMDQVHRFPNLRGLPEADKFFMDPRMRQLEEFIYPDHNKALDLVFNRGKWNEAWLVYDEDDDCERWERVELLDPKEPYTMAPGKVAWMTILNRTLLATVASGIWIIQVKETFILARLMVKFISSVLKRVTGVLTRTLSFSREWADYMMVMARYALPLTQLFFR